jgi:hypothetical protein
MDPMAEVEAMRVILGCSPPEDVLDIIETHVVRLEKLYRHP